MKGGCYCVSRPDAARLVATIVYALGTRLRLYQMRPQHGKRVLCVLEECAAKEVSHTALPG